MKVGDKDPQDIPLELPMSIMRVLVEMYYDFQKTRIEAGNRALMNAERNSISEEDLEKYGVKDIFDAAKKFENDIKNNGIKAKIGRQKSKNWRLKETFW